jgi:ABC-type sugar transport system ATPase subunit
MDRNMNTPELIRMTGVSKSFGHIQALDTVDISLRHNEVLALVGDNAAGKSTLLKTLAGVHPLDSGTIHIEGRRVEINRPGDARMEGIETIYQDFMLAPNLDITKNIFLGRELTVSPWLKWLKRKKMDAAAARVLQSLGFSISMRTRVENLSGGQQQVVAIARALLNPPKVILMDEPTASLSVGAIDRFLVQVKELKDRGCSIIYVSHRLPDIMEVADRIVIIRTGRIVGERMKSETSIEELVRLMMGIAA